MPVVGRLTAKFDADTRSLDASLGNIESAVNGTTQQVTAGFGKMEGELRKSTRAIKAAGAQVKESVGNLVLKDRMDAGVALFGQLAGAVDGFRQEMDRAGGQADDLRDRLAATFGDLADEKAKLAEQGLTLGFSAEETADALVNLKKFGADSAETLGRLQDAARFTNQSVSGLAESFGKFEKFGDAKSIKALQKELGATGPDLAQFGAALDGNNKVLLDNAAQVNAAKDALRAYMDQNFAGAAERQADAATQLSGELEILKREIGANVVGIKEGFAPAMLGLVKHFRDLPNGVKAAIGVGAEFVGMGASIAATALTMGSQLVILSSNTVVLANAQKAGIITMGAFRSAVLFLTGPLGLALVAITALGAGIQKYINELNNANAAQDTLTNQEGKRLAGLHKQREIIGKSAQELLAMGKTTRDVGTLILGLQEQAQAATDKGEGRRAASIRAQIDGLQKVRGELGELKKVELAAAVGAPSNKEKAAKDRNDKRAAAAQERKDLAAKRADERTAETERKEELDRRLDGIRAEASAGIASKTQQITALREVAATANVTASERRTIMGQIAALQGQIVKEEAAAHKQAEAAKTAESKREAANRGKATSAAERQARADAKKDDSQEKADLGKIESLAKEKAQAEARAFDEEIKKLEGDLGKNKGALQAIEAIQKKKLDLAIAQIAANREATVKETKNEDIKKAAVLTAEAQITEARATSANELANIKKKEADILKADLEKFKTTLDEKKQAEIKSRIGGDKSNVFTDVSEGFGIDLGDFSLGDVKKQPSAAKPTITGTIDGKQQGTGTLNAPAQGQPTPGQATTIAPAQKELADYIVAGVTNALKNQPVHVTVENNVAGQKTAGSVTGTAEQLSKQKNVISPNSLPK